MSEEYAGPPLSTIIFSVVAVGLGLGTLLYWLLW